MKDEGEGTIVLRKVEKDLKGVKTWGVEHDEELDWRDAESAAGTLIAHILLESDLKPGIFPILATICSILLSSVAIIKYIEQDSKPFKVKGSETLH